MNTFMDIMSQLFWGVTVGALQAAFSTIACAILMALGLGGVGWWLLQRLRANHRDKD